MSFKKKLEKFHRWQRDPKYFSPNREKKNHCQCCGEDFAGNYCPTCGQRATLGPINWESVRTGLMDVWGLGGRSLPRTLWHLLLRPGYLIGDYISGKRQVSFPPVKMLVIVALVTYLIANWTDPSFSEDTISRPFSDSMSSKDKFNYYFSYFLDYILIHIDWFSLFILSSLIVPTWVAYRHAPQHSHHTLPQGFFIQVFNSIVLVLLALFATLSYFNDDATSIIFGVFIFLHLLRTYKQLFGYNWWGTTWRLVVVATTGSFILIAVLVLFAIIIFAIYGDWELISKNYDNFLLYVLAIVIPLGITHLINKRQAKAAKD